MHGPAYGTGYFGSDKLLAQTVEEFLDENPNQRIRAIFSGHDHVFAAFKRKDVFLFVNGVGGGKLDHPFEYKSGYKLSRKWPTDELHGPLNVTGSRTQGYQYHLDSINKYTKTVVKIEGEKITYSCVNLLTNKTELEYIQKIHNDGNSDIKAAPM